MKVFRFVPLRSLPLLLLLALGVLAFSNSAQANPGIIIGIDVNPVGNSCTGPAASGDTCTLGTIDRCTFVPNTPGYEFSVDIFVNNLTNGFKDSNDNIYFPDGVLIVQAVNYSAAVALGAQKTGSVVIDMGEDTPDPPGSSEEGSPYHQGTFEGGSTEDASWHRGGVARITFRVAAGAVSGVYGLTLAGPPAAAYLDRQGTAYAVDQIWDANFSPRYALLAVGTPCPLPQDFKQRDPPWNAEYLAGNLACPIPSYGCALSAVSDVLAYHGTPQLTEGYGVVNPGNLNRWLTANHGYDDECRIDWWVANDATGGYVGEPKRILWEDDPDNLVKRKQAIDAALGQGNPPIVRVKNKWGGNHWIVLSGKSGDSYTIVDPDGPSGGTLSDTYGDFYTVVIYGPGLASTSWSVVAYSPIQLLITDPFGRQTGYEASTGGILEDIPLSSYEVEPGIGDDDGLLPPLPDRPYFGQNSPPEGTYSIQAIGVGDGPYQLVVRQVAVSGDTTEEVFSGTATPSSVDLFEVYVQGPASVGGMAELPDLAESPDPNYTAPAGLAAALLALTAGAWYARRRWVR